MSEAIPHFLADTWWYGLSKRLSADDFTVLAMLRASQGFTAIQLVVGIPPEVGPENENAASEVGFPWTLEGAFNESYLALARRRVQELNDLGLLAIVYGGWGHQIAWIGRQAMTAWWLRLIDQLDDLDVIYCLCGESNLWIGQEGRLKPHQSTDELTRFEVSRRMPDAIRRFVRRAVRGFDGRRWRRQRAERRSAWGEVLARVARETTRPIIVHPTSTETGREAVENAHLLAVNTAQTGHSRAARDRIWRLPLACLADDAEKGYVNLEPWYEGIRDSFWMEDQLFAYWASMLAGATAHCYGAHGIWNVGDGRFLAHWGQQTFDEAVALETPRLLGRSHAQLLERMGEGGESVYREREGRLIVLSRRWGGRGASFYPDLTYVDGVASGDVWLPLEGEYVDEIPRRGPCVVFD